MGGQSKPVNPGSSRSTGKDSGQNLFSTLLAGTRLGGGVAAANRLKMYNERKGYVKSTVTSETDDENALERSFFKKYNNPRYDVGSGYADMYLIRFAEMYLVAAEAAASLSASKGDAYWQKALANIEVLHKRARQSVDEGEAAYPTWAGRDFADKKELISEIFWERWYELSCEGHEFFDMRRRGAQFAIDNVIKPVNAFLKEPEQDGQHPDRLASTVSSSGYWQNSWNSVQMSENVQEIRKGLLCAYPESELQYNSALSPSDQNDFFVK